MFKLKFKKAKLLAAYFNAFNAVLDEPTFQVNAEGLTLRDIDPSRVAMFDVNFPSKAFEAFQCDKDTLFTVNLLTLYKLLKTADDTEMVELELDLEKKKLVVTFRGIATRRFRMSLLEDSSERISPPKISFAAKAVLPTKQFLRFMNDANALSDHVHLVAIPSNISVIIGGDLAQGELAFEKSMLTLLECKEPQKAAFSVTYMAEIIKALSEVCPNITLEWATDMPIKVSFELEHLGQLVWFLAPRIETG